MTAAQSRRPSAKVSQMESYWISTYGRKCLVGVDDCTSFISMDVHSHWRTNWDTLRCRSSSTSVVILLHLASRAPQTASDHGGVHGGFNDGDPPKSP